MFNKNRCLLIFIVAFLMILHTVSAVVNFIQGNTSLQIMGLSEKISLQDRHLIFINESEFYKDKKRTFEVGLPSNSFVPQPRKGLDTINYFKSLNLTDGYVYAMMQFETLDGDPTKEQMDLFSVDNITLFEYHGDHTYYAKIPKTILETKSYDFVRWIGIIENGTSKVNSDTRASLNLIPSESINVSILFYEEVNDEQLRKISSIVFD